MNKRTKRKLSRDIKSNLEDLFTGEGGTTSTRSPDHTRWYVKPYLIFYFVVFLAMSGLVTWAFVDDVFKSSHTKKETPDLVVDDPELEDDPVSLDETRKLIVQQERQRVLDIFGDKDEVDLSFPAVPGKTVTVTKSEMLEIVDGYYGQDFMPYMTTSGVYETWKEGLWTRDRLVEFMQSSRPFVSKLLQELDIAQSGSNSQKVKAIVDFWQHQTNPNYYQLDTLYIDGITKKKDYTRQPALTELFLGAGRSGGDCEDLTLNIVVGLLEVGIPAQDIVVLQGYELGKQGQGGHVLIAVSDIDPADRTGDYYIEIDGKKYWTIDGTETNYGNVDMKTHGGVGGTDWKGWIFYPIYEGGKVIKLNPDRSLPHDIQIQEYTPLGSASTGAESINQSMNETLSSNDFSQRLGNPWITTAMFYSDAFYASSKNDDKVSKQIAKDIHNQVSPTQRKDFFDRLTQQYATQTFRTTTINPLPHGNVGKDLHKNHPDALDIFVAEGTDIKNISDGIVVAVGDGRSTHDVYSTPSFAGGNYVIVYNPTSGLLYRYCHLQPGITLKVGEIARSGAIIGKVGHSGENATKAGHGQHLHLEVNQLGGDGSVQARHYSKILKHLGLHSTASSSTAFYFDQKQHYRGRVFHSKIYGYMKA